MNQCYQNYLTFAHAQRKIFTNHISMEIVRIFDLIPYYKNKFQPKDDVLAGKVDGKWVKYSIDQLKEAADNISYGLIKLGIKKGDKIASITPNRPEWNFLDMGIQQVGAIHLPIYPTISQDDYNYILNHAEVKLLVTGESILKKIDPILSDIKSLKHIYTFDEVEGQQHLSKLIELGASNPVIEQLEKIKAEIDPNEILTLIYTSGTTGNPKGVALTHNNLIANIDGVKNYFPVGDGDRILSYLPISHVYERTNIYIYMYLGVAIYYAENMAKIADNLREIKPQMFTTVPRLMEKIYDKIILKGSKLSGIKKSLFFWSVKLGTEFEVEGKSVWYKFKLKIANKLIFSKWRAAVGGNIRAIVSGGAALQPRLGRIFTAAQMPVLQGYGLTETSPVIAVNCFDKGGLKFNTVGRPLFNVEVRIAEDGEILTRGPHVMVGYYKQPELTDEVKDKDGWFHTGDVGELDQDGHLLITGRKKAIFKTAMGKYISPEHIENKLVESPFIEVAFVVGEFKKFAGALIVPEFDYLKTWAEENEVAAENNQELVGHPEVVKQYRSIVKAFNNGLGDYERIQKFKLLENEWSIDTGELTASLKVRRKVVAEKYKEVIESIFE